MEESEKLTALKKAYAEIILNTTKEAAVRIMESERKAVRFQQELFFVKEESLRMLMRLKQMLDAKNHDVEILRMSQQKKIEELEAQLHEAEDIVKELREELREVEAELDRVKNTQSQAESRKELVSVSNSKILSSDKIHEGVNDCCCFPSPDFASIIRRCKEPKLHKNGCTQRIRACESNSCKELREETCKRGNEESDQLHGAVEPSYSNGSKVDRTGKSSVHLGAARSIRRKRKQTTRYSKGKSSSLVNLLHHAAKNSQNEDKALVQLDVASMEQSAEKDQSFVESHIDQASRNPLDKIFADRAASLMILQDYGEDTLSKDLLDEDRASMLSEIAKVEQWSDGDKGLVESRVERNTDEPEKASGLTQCTSDREKLEGSSLNMKALSHDDSTPTQSPDGKFLKYTFQRKRKREFSCSASPNSFVDEKNSKESIAEIEKYSGSLEPKSLSFSPESSRDSPRLVQVAHQLISLSEKEWRQ